jgi:hypothetical protein
MKLKHLNVEQARFVAILAQAARIQRDEVLGNVAERDLGQTSPARGEHNPGAALGFEPLAPDAPQVTALRDAIDTLSASARAELLTLMRIGQGRISVKQWHRGISEAEALGDQVIMAAINEDPDLHDHILKGLYEAQLSS